MGSDEIWTIQIASELNQMISIDNNNSEILTIIFIILMHWTTSTTYEIFYFLLMTQDFNGKLKCLHLLPLLSYQLPFALFHKCPHLPSINTGYIPECLLCMSGPTEGPWSCLEIHTQQNQLTTWQSCKKKCHISNISIHCLHANYRVKFQKLWLWI